MKKWMMFVVAIVVSTGVFAWKAGWLPSANDDILTFVPADTAYYFGGQSGEPIAQFFDGYPVMASSPSQTKFWQSLLDGVNDGDSPQARFFSYFVTEFQNFNSSTFGGLAKTSGLSFTGDVALFSDGLIPVSRIEVANRDVFNALIENAVMESNWQYTWEDLGGAKARLWQLTGDDTDVVIYLAVADLEGSAVITFVTSLDDAEAKQRRFGLIKPKASLATNVDVLDSKKRYNYTDDMLGLIQFDKIAQAILDPKSNRLGRDLLTYLPKERFEIFQGELSSICRSEMNEIISSVPRLVMGYQALNITGDTLEFEMHSVLELKNTAMVSQLQKIQGHLPLHTTVVDDKLIGIGVGVNVDSLPSAVTALWSQFTDSQFDCELLQHAQEQVQQQSPAGLAMVTSMAQGVKGVGLSIFDVIMSDNDVIPQGVDFITSIATKEPASLVNMAKMLPFFANLTLSDDGTPVTLDLPMIPSNIEIKAAIKGSHLVVFSGEKSTKVASELTAEPITPNGFLSMVFNYRKLGDLRLDKLTPSVGNINTCISQYEMAHMFQNLNMDMGVILSFENEGFVSKYNGSLDKSEPVKTKTPGKYRVEFLNHDCKWEFAAVDEIHENGTGRFTQQDDNAACDIYIFNYSWTNKGGVMSFDGSEQLRDSCDVELPEASKEIYSCYLMNVKDDSFQCLYEPATENAFLHRYKRIL